MEKEYKDIIKEISPKEIIKNEKIPWVFSWNNRVINSDFKKKKKEDIEDIKVIWKESLKRSLKQE